MKGYKIDLSANRLKFSRITGYKIACHCKTDQSHQIVGLQYRKPGLQYRLKDYFLLYIPKMCLGPLPKLIFHQCSHKIYRHETNLTCHTKSMCYESKKHLLIHKSFD